MTEDKPYKLPPAAMVADMCAIRAWDDDVDDQSRILHEMSADTIRQLMTRLLAQAHTLEQAEAERDHLLTTLDRRLQRGDS